MVDVSITTEDLVDKSLVLENTVQTPPCPSKSGQILFLS